MPKSDCTTRSIFDVMRVTARTVRQHAHTLIVMSIQLSTFHISAFTGIYFTTAAKFQLKDKTCIVVVLMTHARECVLMTFFHFHFKSLHHYNPNEVGVGVHKSTAAAAPATQENSYVRSFQQLVII